MADGLRETETKAWEVCIKSDWEIQKVAALEMSLEKMGRIALLIVSTT